MKPYSALGLSCIFALNVIALRHLIFLALIIYFQVDWPLQTSSDTDVNPPRAVVLVSAGIFSWFIPKVNIIPEYTVLLFTSARLPFPDSPPPRVHPASLLNFPVAFITGGG